MGCGGVGLLDGVGWCLTWVGWSQEGGVLPCWNRVGWNGKGWDGIGWGWDGMRREDRMEWDG